MISAAVGPYQILERLGAGGMGEVYLGHDPRLDRRVALKCLTSADAGSPDARARILREARAVARLTHPHIAGVYDVLEEGGRAYIVMEYVEGVSLSAYIAGGARSPDEVCAVGRQIASALAAAHANGVIHRDLKPANVQVMHGGTVKVLDFGVARLAVPPATTMETTAAHPVEATVEGNPGTPIYMAPEQLACEPADARSDVYSLGVVLFLMATGRRPYAETTAVTLALAIHKAAAPAARSINPRVPAALSDAIARMLERDPARRFQSASEVESALGAIVSGASSTGARSRGQQLRSRGSMWIAATVVLAASVFVASQPIARWFDAARKRAGGSHLAIVGVLPVDNPSGDPRAESLGAALAELVDTNLASISGVTVLPRSATVSFRQRNDLAALQRDVGATLVIDLAVRAAAPSLVVVARLRRPGADADVWAQTIEGDTLRVEQTLLDEIGRALERTALSRPLTATEWKRLRELPTTSDAALDAYSEARALLDRPDVPGNVDRAIDLLTRATRSDPRFAIAYAALGDAQWIRYSTGDRRPEVAANARAAVMEALKIDPNLSRVHYSLANMLYQTGRYPEAIESLRRALAIQPDSDDSHRLLGRVLIASGDVDRGLAELQKAIDLRPYWNNYYIHGYMLYSTGRYREAVDSLTKATELQPTFSDGFQMLGTTYHMMGDLQQAIGNYEHAARLGPNSGAYANLALAYYTAGHYEQARDAYLEAIKRDERKASLRRDLGDVYVRLGRNAEARAAYEKAIALSQDDVSVNPRNGGAVALIALCEAKLGRRDAAERHAAEAVVLAPSNRDVRVFTAKAYSALRDREAGLAALEAAIALGYEPKRAREDDELRALRDDAGFEAAIGAGVTARSRSSGKGAIR